MTFEEFEDVAFDAYEALPAEIKQNLNMGIAVIPDTKLGKEGLTFVLGEYFFDPMMGRGVRIFYGSFMEVMGDAPEAMIRHEIIRTVKHELRHHVEISAGVDYLGDEDRAKMARIKRRFGLITSDKEIFRGILTRLIGGLAIIIVVIIILYIFVLRYM